MLNESLTTDEEIEAPPVTLRSAQFDAPSSATVSKIPVIEVIEIKNPASNKIESADTVTKQKIDKYFMEIIPGYAEREKILSEIGAALNNDEIKAYFSGKLIENGDFFSLCDLFSAGILAVDNFIEPLSKLRIHQDQLWIGDLISMCKTLDDATKLIKIVKHPHIVDNKNNWPKLKISEMGSFVSLAWEKTKELEWNSMLERLDETKKLNNELKDARVKNQQLKDAINVKSRIATQLEAIVAQLNDVIARNRRTIEQMGQEIDNLEAELANSRRNRPDNRPSADLANVGLDTGTLSKIERVTGKEGVTKIVKGMQRLLAGVVHPDLFSGEKKNAAEEILKMVNAAVTKILQQA